MTHNQNLEKSPKQRKAKILIKSKMLINEPIPLSNRFSLMDIEDSNETTTHIKADTIKLQKRLKKINTKDDPTENETTNPTKKKWNKSYKNRHWSSALVRQLV